MINNLPTIFEIVTGSAKKHSKEKSSVSNHSSNKVKSGSKGRGSDCEKHSKRLDGEDDEDRGETLWGACGEHHAADQFWICCDVREKWFHGKCVKITVARAEHVKQYKCPTCSNKRARP